MSRPALLLLLGLLSGCAHHHPILSQEQQTKANLWDNYVVSKREVIYREIASAKALGALVIIPEDLAKAPHIIPGASPLLALAEHSELAAELAKSSQSGCYFVYAETSIAPPLIASCGSIGADAIALQSVTSALPPLIAVVNLQVSQIAALEAGMQTVSKAFKEDAESQSRLNTLLKEAFAKLSATYVELQKQFAAITEKLSKIK